MRPLKSLADAARQWALCGYRINARSLALYRIAFAGTWLLALFHRYAWVGRYPDGFWNPAPGPFRLFGGFPPVAAMTAIQWAIAVALVCVLLGYKTRFASYAAGVLIIFANGFEFGFGRISHMILAPLVLILFAESGWGSALSIDARRTRKPRRVETWTVSLVLLATGLMMLTSALPKLRHGWLSPDSSAVVGEIVVQRVKAGTNTWLPLPSGVGAETLDWFVVLLEIAFPIAVLMPNCARLFVAAATIFHLGILVSMDIDFSSQLLVYAVLLPWEAIGRPLTRLRADRWRGLSSTVVRHPLVTVGVVAAAYIAVETQTGAPLRLLFSWTRAPDAAVALLLHVIAAVIGVAYIVYASAGFIVRGRRPAFSRSAGGGTGIA